MKLSDLYKVNELVKERSRLRDSIGDALADTDIKVELRGREAQGVVRERLIAALRTGWQGELNQNTENLKKLGVEADDPPVRPTLTPAELRAMDV